METSHTSGGMDEWSPCGGVVNGEVVEPSDQERMRSFATALEALRKETEAQLGAEDLQHIERVARISRTAEIAGRILIHISLDPLTFGLGVGSLWLHKTLELMEIGHTVLHGTYDKLDGANDYRSGAFRWRAPIDERCWMVGHNVRHHQYTNIAGRDPDLDFGGLRLSERIPHRKLHRLQPLSNFATWLGFATGINLNVTGLLDLYLGKSQPPVLKDHGWHNVRAAHVAFLRKAGQYYAREQLLFPLLAGPFFWKVSLGNWLSDVARDLWAASIIYCGHVGARDYPEGTRSGSRPSWYVMQVESAYNVDVSWLTSILCGALDKQIEHHLFPRLPPNRLRALAPRVRSICEQHGVRYQSAPWSLRLRDVATRLRRLSRPARDSELRR